MSKIFKNSRTVFLLIIILAFLLRFHQLSSNPPSLTWDEVAFGYNAYSLGIDGRDEFGRFMPLDYLESFGDFKPPLYAYLSVLPVKFFGLTEFSIRFASAFFGVLTVLATYFLVCELFKNENYKKSNIKLIALIASFLLAISPWHIMLSRAAFEANVASFFIVSGVYFLISSIHKKSWLIILSAVSFALSLYAFNTARVVAPLLALALVIGFGKRIWRIKKAVIFAGIAGVVMVLPIVSFLFSPQAKLRYNEVNIFSDLSIIERSNQEIANDGGGLLSRVLHNRRFYYAQEVLSHYFDNLSFDFLFVNGDQNPKFSDRNTGQMYLWEIPFFIAGSFFLFKSKIGHWWVIPVWLVIGLIPASLARETPHALRTEAALPTFQIISAYGIFTFLNWINLRKKILFISSKYIIVFLFVVIISNLVYFIHGYYMHYARETSKEWQYGYKDAISYLKSVENKYDEIRIGRLLGRPYVYALFYLKTDPQFFRQTLEAERDVFGFVHVKRFGKYYFGDGEINEAPSDKNVLVLERPERIPKNNTRILKQFNFLNGEGAIAAYVFK